MRAGLSAACAVVWVAACGSEVTTPAGAGAGGVSLGGAGGSLASSSSASGGFDGGPLGEPCPPEPCDDGVVCVHPDALCGAGMVGICSALTDCSLPLEGDVCGCDGQIYEGKCEALAAGVDAAKPDACTTPAGYFPCMDATFCDSASEYCHANVGFDYGIGCQPLPQACDPAEGGVLDCSCIDATFCDLSSCEITPEGGLSIVCTTAA